MNLKSFDRVREFLGERFDELEITQDPLKTWEATKVTSTTPLRLRPDLPTRMVKGMDCVTDII